MQSPLLIEFVGTFLLFSVALWVGNPIAVGMTLATIAYLEGHYNPVGAYLAYMQNTSTLYDLCMHIVMEFIGGICAFVIYINAKNIN